jgi:hypothetical protein
MQASDDAGVEPESRRDDPARGHRALAAGAAPRPPRPRASAGGPPQEIVARFWEQHRTCDFCGAQTRGRRVGGGVHCGACHRELLPL